VIGGLLHHLLGAFPDFYSHGPPSITLKMLSPWSMCLAGSITASGGIVPTGNRLEVRAVLIFLFDGENLNCEKVYFDHATVCVSLVLPHDSHLKSGRDRDRIYSQVQRDRGLVRIPRRRTLWACWTF
jgi:hypothetical protein